MGMSEEVERSGSPCGFPPETVLDRVQLAAALRVSDDTIERSGLPVSYALGKRCPRYIWGDVVEWIRKGVAA
jgi:hypothetical protein